MSFVMVQTVTLHSPDWQLLWNFVVRSQQCRLFTAGCMIGTHPLPYSAHLCCSVDFQGQGKAWRFASQVQRWAFLASQPDELIDMAGLLVDTDRQRNPRSSWVSDSFGKKSLSFHYLGFEQHWSHPSLACISSLFFKQDSKMPKMCYNWIFGDPLAKIIEAIYPICVCTTFAGTASCEQSQVLPLLSRTCIG